MMCLCVSHHLNKQSHAVQINMAGRASVPLVGALML